MNPIPHLLALAKLYGEAKAIPPVTVSWRAFGDSKRIRALEQGKTITIRRAEAVISWFSDNWPSSAKWPSDIPRPEPTGASSALTLAQGRAEAGSQVGQSVCREIPPVGTTGATA